ncbi:PP2C family protein-serine/threonine phosphatase [Planosporangium sp. 12N6]|uniref:PP2C family protein-serine/threonine phosphatase n=1 Tax=Planosporangium spinosum TaxID=3402278 RepID=UPI003CE8F49E
MAAGPEVWQGAITEVLRGSRLAQPSDLMRVVNTAVHPLGIDIAIYLVDLEQRTLRALSEPGKPMPAPLPVDGTLAGRAFMTVSSLPAAARPWRLWVPLLDGNERLGVLDVALPDRFDPGDPVVRDGLELLAALVGHLVATKGRYGDSLVRTRRSRPLSTASELLRQLLPPSTFATQQMVCSAILEPIYQIGGDAFDYAVDIDVARVAIFDAVGHSLHAGLTAAVALAAIRSARVAGHGLYAMARAADAALTESFTDQRFVTAVLAEIDLVTGALRYLNAGHPPPVLLRGGKVVAALDRGRRMPLGLDDPAIEIAELPLESGDRLLFYTDGFTEARNERGEEFGLDRLIDFAERHAAAGLPVPETLRRLTHDVLAHQYGPLHDDATLLMVSWSAVDAREALP